MSEITPATWYGAVFYDPQAPAEPYTKVSTDPAVIEGAKSFMTRRGFRLIHTFEFKEPNVA